MNRGPAPRALRRPISLIRSVTETSMMFITPIPPTSNEMIAIPPSITVSVSSTEVAACRIDSSVAIEKSASSGSAMPCRFSSRLSACW